MTYFCSHFTSPLIIVPKCCLEKRYILSRSSRPPKWTLKMQIVSAYLMRFKPLLISRA